MKICYLLGVVASFEWTPLVFGATPNTSVITPSVLLTIVITNTITINNEHDYYHHHHHHHQHTPFSASGFGVVCFRGDCTGIGGFFEVDVVDDGVVVVCVVVVGFGAVDDAGLLVVVFAVL